MSSETDTIFAQGQCRDCAHSIPLGDPNRPNLVVCNVMPKTIQTPPTKRGFLGKKLKPPYGPDDLVAQHQHAGFAASRGQDLSIVPGSGGCVVGMVDADGKFTPTMYTPRGKTNATEPTE